MASRRLTNVERARIFKALADPTRIEIVDILAKHGALCGTELADRLGISVALLSHHWDVLVNAGLIHKTRVGQLRYGAMDPERLHEAVGAWDEAVCDQAARCEARASVGDVAARKGAAKKTPSQKAPSAKAPSAKPPSARAPSNPRKPR